MPSFLPGDEETQLNLREGLSGGKSLAESAGGSGNWRLEHRLGQAFPRVKKPQPGHFYKRQ